MPWAKHAVCTDGRQGRAPLMVRGDAVPAPCVPEEPIRPHHDGTLPIMLADANVPVEAASEEIEPDGREDAEGGERDSRQNFTL